MKTILLFSVAFLLLNTTSKAQDTKFLSPSPRQAMTIEPEEGKMLHDFVKPNLNSELTNYLIGQSPEGDYPGDLFYSADGSKIFIANSYSNNVTILNADGTLSDNISVGSYPITLAANEEYMVVPCSMSSDVYIINLSDNSIAATIDVNGEPVSVVIKGTKAYVGCDTDNYYADECAIIDLTTLSLENTITNFPVKLTSYSYTFNNGRKIYTYNNFVVTDDGSYIIAGNWTTKINFYNSTTGAIDFELDATDVKRVSESGDGSTLIAISPENLYQVDIATHAITETVNLGSYSVPFPYKGIANEDGTKAFVALSGNKSGFINFTTSSVNTISQTQTPTWITTNPDRSKVISGQYRFSVLDFETEVVLGQHLGLSTQKGAVAPDFSKAIATSFAKFEGPFFYNLSNLNSITLENYVPTGETPEGDAPMRIKITPDGQNALIINELSHNISIFHIPTKTFTSHIQLDGATMDIEITNDGDYAVISTAYLESEIVIFDINAGTVVKEITAGSSLQYIEILPDNSKAYVRDYSNGIFVINLDGASSNLETTIPCGNGTYSSYGFGINSDIALTPDGNYLFVGAVANNEVQIINTETDEIVAQLPTGGSPYYFAFNATGDKAIVCDLSNDKYTLINIDDANFSILGDFYVSGEMPFRLTYNSINDETGITVYGNEVFDEGGQLLTVNPNTGEEISLIEYTEDGTGNVLQVIYDNDGNAIVLTEYKIIFGTEEYVFPVRMKYMAYSSQENVALAISPVNDMLYVIDILSINVEAYPIYTKTFILAQNKPNPAIDLTTINYELKEKAEVKLSVFDNTGRLIQQYNNGIQEKGGYSLELNVSELNSGIYYYTLQVNKLKQTKKLIIQ